MTDVTTAEASSNLVLAVAPAPSQQTAVPSESEAPERVLPEPDHPIGTLRQAILDHLLDSAEAGPQTVGQILAAMPAGTSRNTVSVSMPA
jgi:hypothetical protein